MYKRAPMEKQIKVANLFVWIWFRLYSKLWKSLSMFSARLPSPVFWKGEGRRLNKDRINTSPQTKLCWSLAVQHPVHAHPFPVVHVKHVEYNFHFIVHFCVHFILTLTGKSPIHHNKHCRNKACSLCSEEGKRSCCAWRSWGQLLPNADTRVSVAMPQVPPVTSPHRRPGCCAGTHSRQKLVFHFFGLLGTSRTNKFFYCHQYTTDPPAKPRGKQDPQTWCQTRHKSVFRKRNQ